MPPDESCKISFDLPARRHARLASNLENLSMTANRDDKQISIKNLPVELHQALREKAVAERTTQQIIVLKALKEAGLPVPDYLLTPHRRVK